VVESRLRPRKTPRQPRAHETRARILDAARTVFARHGYSAGTTNRIADEAGLSVGSLYQYFPNKDAILVELVNAHIDDGTHEVLAALQQAENERADLAGSMRVIVSALVRLHARDRRLHQVLFEESPRPPSLLRRLRDLEDGVVEVFADRLRTERPTLASPELTARITIVTTESLVHRLVATDRPLDTEQFVDEVTRMIVNYLDSPSTSSRAATSR
jgi:AcrR family transcriptional regulator